MWSTKTHMLFSHSHRFSPHETSPDAPDIQFSSLVPFRLLDYSQPISSCTGVNVYPQVRPHCTYTNWMALILLAALTTEETPPHHISLGPPQNMVKLYCGNCVVPANANELHQSAPKPCSISFLLFVVIENHLCGHRLGLRKQCQGNIGNVGG